MDKSYEFKRKSLYWFSVLNPDSDSVVHGSSDEVSVDRYSAISAILFNRLLSFESVVSPYTILINEHTYKNNPYGSLILPKNENLSSFIRSKRAAFDKIGIKAIVHDTNVIGDMINQMEGSLNNSHSSNESSSSFREHREGINSCLKHVYQIVKDHVEKYERFKLKFESSLNNHLKVMTENLTEVPNLEDSSSFGLIPDSYLDHFVSNKKKEESHAPHHSQTPQLDPNVSQPESYTSQLNFKDSKLGYQDSKLQSQLDFQDYKDGNDANESREGKDSQVEQRVESPESGNPKPEPSHHSSQSTNVLSVSRPLTSNLGSLKYDRGVYNISTNYLDPSEMQDQQVTSALEQQHARTVSSITDQLKASELRTINNVQERIAEISSMFVKFTGAVEGQNETFLQITENVQESITNIEKTQETLKKSSSERLPFYHRILCIALTGLSVILLFLDYLKSSKGSYLF